MTDRPDFTTRSVRAGLESDDVTGAVVPPLHLSSTYAFRGYGDKRKYDYSRSGNPTRDLLGNALADLEGGAGGVITGTGMGAITLVGHLIFGLFLGLAFLKMPRGGAHREWPWPPLLRLLRERRRR